MKEIKLGHVYFVGVPSGAHVHVTTLGEGARGHRPLLGHITMTPDEWASLVDMAEERDLLVDGVAYNQEQIEALRAEVAKLRRYG